jgi:hypothetical protein
MANKNKKKKPSPPKPQMSPVKYVTSGRARLLPIFECWINQNWEEEGLVTIIVSRNHSTGNVTFATFLMDMYCLGLKDTTTIFSKSAYEYRDIVDSMFESHGGKQMIDYTLAHNIIYGGIAYAEDLGFKPEADWAFSQFILEEDTEDIELIDVAFGKDGRPCFINGPYDNLGKIVSKLEKSVGKGNFDVVLIDGGDFDDEDYDDDEGDVDDIQDITYEEVK